MQHIQKQGGPRSGDWPLATLHALLDSSPFFSHSCVLLCARKHSTHLFAIDSALFARKHLGGSIRLSRTESAKGNIMARFCLVLASLLRYLLTSRNGNALPAAMGAAAKRAHRLQERRSCLALN